MDEYMKKLIYFLICFISIFHSRKDDNIFVKYLKDNKKSIIIRIIFIYFLKKYNMNNQLNQNQQEFYNNNQENLIYLNNSYKEYNDAEKFKYFFNKSLNTENKNINDHLINTNYLKTVFLIGDEKIDQCNFFVKTLTNNNEIKDKINFVELDFRFLNDPQEESNKKDKELYILNIIRKSIESFSKTDIKKNVLYIKGLEDYICDLSKEIPQEEVFKKQITIKLSNLINRLDQENNNNFTLIISLPNENNLDNSFKLNTKMGEL